MNLNKATFLKRQLEMKGLLIQSAVVQSRKCTKKYTHTRTQNQTNSSESRLL